MKTKKKSIKSVLGYTAACSALLLSGVGVMSMQKPNLEAHAVGVDNIPVSITNSNFDSNKSSTYPYSPNSYTAYNHGKEIVSSSDADPNVKAGVINLAHEDYETRFSFAKRSSLDDYVLMIDSTDKDDHSLKHDADYGYVTNPNQPFKLEANSKYMFTVDVLTATDAKIASLYLFNNKNFEEPFAEIKQINSYNDWTTYTFFVSTNNSESLELTLGMYLQGAGTVLFDNLYATKLSDVSYDIEKVKAPANTSIEEDRVDNVIRTFNVNYDGKIQYKTNENGTPELVETKLKHIEFDSKKKSTTTREIDTDGQNAYALLINNEDKTYSQYETESLFTFEQNKIYKVSVNVKTRDLDGTAFLKLIRTDIPEDDKEYKADQNLEIKITSNTYSSNESVTNDYSTYSFYINSHSSKSLTYKLVFGLGSQDALSTGKMYLSEIEVSKINYATFETAKDTEKVNFVDAYSNNSIYLNNGDFNAFKIEDYNSPMPATPIDWTVKTGTNYQKYGVVNTSTFADDLKDLSLSNLSNPLADKNQNVLMMYSETTDTLSYTSATKTLEANSYHKFEIDVLTQNAPLTVSLVTKKNDTEIVLTSKTLKTNGLWGNAVLYIYTGYQTLDVSLKLTLNTTGYGYAYVDNAAFDYILTPEQLESEFKSADTTASNIAVADLSNILSSASNEEYSALDFFTYAKDTTIDQGSITFNSGYLTDIISGTENLEIFNAISNGDVNKKALAIWTTNYVNHTITSNIGFTLTSGDNKYYKISVDVFTQNLKTSEDAADAELLGAGIKLSGFEDAFTSIQSNNVWTTYTFYIKPTSTTTTYLEFSLGNENAQTNGSVFFTNIEFVADVEASEFEAAENTSFIKVLETVEEETEDDTTEDDSSTSESNKISKTTWIYLIPGLLTALAILIALVGFAVRKIKWKKPTKKSKTAYDRNKTVSVQYYTRKATTLREEKVRELTADLNKINAERKQFEDQYKVDLSKLREMKIKRANSQEIAKLEKEMKKNQKMSSTLGVTANRINDELQYVKTDAYLNSLVKKLSKESALKQVEETEENKENK